MAKTQVSKIENRLIGKNATLEYNRQSRKAVLREAQDPPKTTPKTEKVEKTEKTKKPILKEIEQKVLDFLTSLDHPATSNEVRDKFGFPLRAPARRIFRRLAALGYGENRKVKRRYLFFVKGKKYPPKEPPKAEPKETKKSEPKKA